MTSARWLRNIAVAGGLIAALPLASIAPASADPILDPLVNTTCTYAQLKAALTVQSPALSRQLDNRPDMQANLQQFLALPIDQRQQRIAEQQAATPPQVQAMLAAQIGPQVTQVANTCMNY